MAGSGRSLLTVRAAAGKIPSTMQLGSFGWTSYAYFAWRRPTPSLSG